MNFLKNFLEENIMKGILFLFGFYCFRSTKRRLPMFGRTMVLKKHFSGSSNKFYSSKMSIFFKKIVIENNLNTNLTRVEYFFILI